MTDINSPQWLEWAREIQALSQTGLAFTQNEYERERYRRLSEIAAEIVASHTGLAKEIVQKKFSPPARLRHAENRRARRGGARP